ncbi:FAD-dependent monooxygenase [Candidatus Nitronereus thalassa]|uniref:FAD-dependent monooxygenase n=1 Tax=Candidatus Nitronereus thalassa TaxID=3020898 RepID=A0ABU3KBC9_9BACT|nr:FAD-dependent monooxygenase [Candidatus Nitronereus thalassa]MDT7043713.1 FAD-dependent monooxygenase [Candidatus Nitronereus thalassa]
MTPTGNSAEVLIVGAGPTGLTLACDLARRGVPFRIIDQQEQPSQHSKALAIHARTLECFEQLELTDDLCRRGRRIHALNLYADGQCIARFDFQHLDTPYPFALVLPQNETEQFLIERLTLLGERVERPNQLETLEFLRENIMAIIQDPRSNQRRDPQAVSWVVGCGGARSAVRTCLEIPFEGERYDESFLLGDLTVNGDLPSDEAHVFLSPNGVLLAIPLPWEDCYRLVVDETHQSLRKVDADITIQDFQDYWRQRVGRESGSRNVLSQLCWHSQFRIARRLVRSYRKGHVLLAGDAAHVHSPVGGQGMNTGIQDAFNLGWKLALVSGGYSRESLLDTYEQERRPVAASLLSGTHWGTKLITLRHPVSRWVRNHLVTLVSQSQVFQQRMVHALAELDTQYPQSPIVRAQQINTTVKQKWKTRIFSGRGALNATAPPDVGERAPDVSFRQADMKVCRLSQFLRSPHHTMLIFIGRTLPRESQPMLENLHDLIGKAFVPNVRILVVQTANDQSNLHPECSIIRDSDGTLHLRNGADLEQCCVYVIRPDGYVGYKSQPIEVTQLQQYFSKIILSPSS